MIPEVLAYAIFDRLTAAAAAMDDDRTMDQRRADLFCDLLLTAMASTAMGIDLDAIRPTVQVTIAASTLAGRDDAMAELDGVGPIQPDEEIPASARSALPLSRMSSEDFSVSDRPQPRSSAGRSDVAVQSRLFLHESSSTEASGCRCTTSMDRPATARGDSGVDKSTRARVHRFSRTACDVRLRRISDVRLTRIMV